MSAFCVSCHTRVLPRLSRSFLSLPRASTPMLACIPFVRESRAYLGDGYMQKVRDAMPLFDSILYANELPGAMRACRCLLLGCASCMHRSISPTMLVQHQLHDACALARSSTLALFCSFCFLSLDRHQLSRPLLLHTHHPNARAHTPAQLFRHHVVQLEHAT